MASGPLDSKVTGTVGVRISYEEKEGIRKGSEKVLRRFSDFFEKYFKPSMDKAQALFHIFT